MYGMKIRIASMVLILVFLISLGTLAYKSLEKWSWVDSFYFSTTTLTTIGFGDLHPTSDASKLFTVFYVLFGVSFVLFSLTVFGDLYFEHAHGKFERRVNYVTDKIKHKRRPWKIRQRKGI